MWEAYKDYWSSALVLHCCLVEAGIGLASGLLKASVPSVSLPSPTPTPSSRTPLLKLYVNSMRLNENAPMPLQQQEEVRRLAAR